MSKTFLANSIRMPVERQQLSYFDADYLEFEEVATENKVL